MLTPADAIANTPDYMCWLCRREIEVSRSGKLRGHRPSICRILAFNPLTHSSAVSGIGYRVPTDAPSGLAFTVPRRISASLTYLPLTPEKVEMVTTTGRSPLSPFWTFPIHADCWELLTPRIRAPTCATVLSKALVSLNWDWSFPSPTQQHNINNYSLPRLLLSPYKAPYTKTHHRHASLQQPSTFSGLAGELGLPAFNTSPLSKLGVNIPDRYPLPMSTPSPTAPTKKQSSSDIFLVLPPPVLQHVLSFTTTPDIPNLRLASKAMARAARVDALPQTFWASRFDSDFEMGFAKPEDGDDDEGVERDWRSLYFAVKKAVRAHGGNGTTVVAGLKKRKYWWERLGQVVRFCERWEGMSLRGKQFAWVEQLDREEDVFLVLKEVGCVSALMRQGDGTPRECETMCLPLDWCGGNVEAHGISIVDMAGQKYVSGLRLFLRGGSGPRDLGYILPESESLVHFHPGEALFGFRVRVDDDAVRALKVISQTPLGRLHVSPWIGYMLGTGSKPPLSSESPITPPWEPVEELPLMGKFGSGSAVVASFDVSFPFTLGSRLLIGINSISG